MAEATAQRERRSKGGLRGEIWGSVGAVEGGSARERFFGRLLSRLAVILHVATGRSWVGPGLLSSGLR